MEKFVRVVEVFPPRLSPKDGLDEPVDLKLKLRAFVGEVRDIAGVSDYVLVADLKDPRLAKVSSVAAATLLRRELGVNSAPVVVARDANRPAVASAVLTAFSGGVTAIMLAWGDRFPDGAKAANVYDFPSVAATIRLTRELASRTGVRAKIFAPVDLSKDASQLRRNAASRLSAGADLLLAQPPTVDAEASFDAHIKALEEAGLAGKVLLNVFPFRDLADVEACASRYGWPVPEALREKAWLGRPALLREAGLVAQRARREGLPGVYVSTRGEPSSAKTILA